MDDILADRHHAGWELTEQKGTVESYSYRHQRGGLIGYQRHELNYVFTDQYGILREGIAHKYVAFSLQEDKSFQKGDIVSLERYRYLKDVYRVTGTQAYPSDWRLPVIAIFFLSLLWLLSWFAWRRLWFLRNGKTTLGRLIGSETVLGSRQDSYEFIVDHHSFTTIRTVLQPKNYPVLEEQIVFYVPSNPKRAKILADISTNLKIERGRLMLRKSDWHVWGTMFIGLLAPIFIVTVLLMILAPYLPF